LTRPIEASPHPTTRNTDDISVELAVAGAKVLTVYNPAAEFPQYASGNRFIPRKNSMS
jgi:hypothetical protein